MLLVSAGSMVAGFAGTALIAVVGMALADERARGRLALWFLLLCIVAVVAKSLSEVALLRLSQTNILNMRLSLSRKLIATPQRRLQAIGKDELMVILTRDLDTFSAALQALPHMFSNIVVVIASLCYIGVLSWPTLLLFVSGMVLCVGGYLFAERWPSRLLAHARGEAQHLQSGLRNLVEGSRELQLNAVRSRHFVDHVLGTSVRTYFAAYVRGMSFYTWYTNIGGILLYQGVGMVLFLLPFAGGRPDGGATTLVLVMLYVIRPIGEVIFALPTVRQADIARERVLRLDHDLADARVPADPAGSAGVFGEHLSSLELRGVRYTYATAHGDRFEFGPLSLTLRAGEILFVVGGNGTGKTTLAMLLLGLFESDGGDILLNGVSVTDANREAYRQMFSAILADGHLFEDLPRADAGAVRAAEAYLRKLGLPERVTIRDGRFSTIATSSGQRKRLALVSAYLEDRPVYLFDEWAADQDPVFKRVFYSEILPELKARGKTVLVISHDDGFFHCADRIVALDHGRLRPVGVA